MLYKAKREFFHHSILNEQSQELFIVKHHNNVYDILDTNKKKVSTIIVDTDTTATIILNDHVGHTTMTLHDTSAFFHPSKASMLEFKYNDCIYHIAQTKNREYFIYEDMKKIGTVTHMLNQTVELNFSKLSPIMIALFYVLSLTMLHEDDVIVV